MKREIKFRAYHKDLKQILEVYVINQQRHAGMEYCGICNGWFGDNHQVEFTYDEVVWMQYIGLKDKNGKEIYEGDILKSLTGYQYVIELKWYKIGHTSSAYGYQHEPSDVIIGNIYENPEIKT